MTAPSAKTIVLSGGSGLIGTGLIRYFAGNRIQTIRLVRRAPVNPSEIGWNYKLTQPPGDLSRMESLYAAIHLGGANISSHRWTAAYKREIFESRIGTTRALVNLFKAMRQPPRTLLCASAVGFYGDRGDQILPESSPQGRGFLADTCRAWEAEAERATEAGIRVVHLRFGVVLTKEGGALRQLLPVFRAGLGGRLGDGRQWMSWIAMSDVVRAVLHILDADSLAGPVNVVAPIPVTNGDFSRALGCALDRRAIFPVPRVALRLALGDMADESLLASTRAIPERLAASGFHFDLPEIYGALQSML